MSLPAFFPSLETQIQRTLRRRGGTGLSPRAEMVANPCLGCSREPAIKVLPALPPQRKLTAIGLAPGELEEEKKLPFVGESGQLLRKGLSAAGLDAIVDVGYANLGRCRPEGDNFETPGWAEAEDRCWHHLTRDLAGGMGPLLLLGSRPLQRFTGNKKASVRRERGLWRRLPDGRDAFVALHPSGILRERNEERQHHLRRQFFLDLRRMADRILGREKVPAVKWQAFRLGDDGSRRALRQLAKSLDPWFFDIETIDAKGSPARPGVATDPFHPDYRVRGVAVAFGPDQGVWFEFDEAMDRAAARELLDPAFRSEAEKGAFVSGFDANGLIVPGWVTEVRNLVRDPWLMAIALDMAGEGHSLERLAVDVLGEPQPKAGVDRTRIREMSLEAVAEYAVRDACCEYRLDRALRERLGRGEYL